jgi:hypothetical protein
MSDHAKKSLKKSKPASPDILPSNASIDEKRSYNIRALQHQVDMKSFELAMVELKVLASNKAYNYFKKSWKLSMSDAEGDLDVAKDLIFNIETHLDGNKPCDDCKWHSLEGDYLQSFGPFVSISALAVIHLWCEKYASPDTLAKYILSDTTNYCEYVNSLEGHFNLKIKHSNDSSYDTYALYASALANSGPIVDKHIVLELGLPWEATQDYLLQQRINAHEYNSARKKSEPYLTERAQQRQKRKDDTGAGKKDQNYKSTTLAMEKDKNYQRAVAKLPLLYPLDNKSKKRRKTSVSDAGDF